MTNSSSGLIFLKIRADFKKYTGKIQAIFIKNPGEVQVFKETNSFNIDFIKLKTFEL